MHQIKGLQKSWLSTNDMTKFKPHKLWLKTSDLDSSPVDAGSEMLFCISMFKSFRLSSRLIASNGQLYLSDLIDNQISCVFFGLLQTGCICPQSTSICIFLEHYWGPFIEWFVEINYFFASLNEDASVFYRVSGKGCRAKSQLNTWFLNVENDGKFRSVGDRSDLAVKKECL